MAEISLKKLVTRLLLVVAAMFVFGFALVPIYDVMCKALGINGKTGGQYADQGQQIDASRQVRVQFLSTNAIDMVWEFYPKSDDIVVHPGERDGLHRPQPQRSPDERPGHPEHLPQQRGHVFPQDRVLLLYPAGAAARGEDRDAGAFHR